MFNNDPREPNGSRITESGTMSKLSLVVEQDGTVRLRPEAEINEILKYRRQHSEELSKYFERFGFRQSTPDGLPDRQGEEEVQPEREEIKLPGERHESGSVDVFQPHRSSAQSPEEFSTVKSINQIAVIEGAAEPSWEGYTNNEWLGEEFSDANGVPGDEDSLPSESDQVYRRKMPSGEHSNPRHRIIHPIYQPDDLRGVGESRGARGLGFDDCAERFPDGENLGAHRDVLTGEERFICDVCEKKFKYASELREHQRTHTGEKPFACDACGKNFTEAYNLKRHRRIHTGERPFECDVCKKKFREFDALKRHQQTHTGEKPFTCGICGQSFTRSDNFANHKRIHTGERPFECDVCAEKFNTASTRRRHQLTHTGEKPFTCDVCGIKFTQANTAKRHQQTHTGEKPFACDVCGTRFSRSWTLRKHQRDQHEDKTPSA